MLSIFSTSGVVPALRGGAISTCLRRSGGAALAALIATGCAAAVDRADESVVASEQTLSACAPNVPPELVVEEGNKLAFTFEGVGAQIYDCKLAADGSTAAWTFRAPEADLLAKHGRIAGSHYAGPTWESIDGSTVVASKVNGVTVDASAIPWLLLQAVSHTGNGRMSKVTYIQRLNTVGGLIPTSGCDVAHAGAVAAVDYSATYAFYEAKHNGH